MTKREHDEWTIDQKLHELDIEIAHTEEQLRDLLERRKKLLKEKELLPTKSYLKRRINA